MTTNRKPINLQVVTPKRGPYNPPKPPDSLGKEATAWWRQVTAEYIVDSAPARLLLQVGLECFDQMRLAQAAVDSDGYVLESDAGTLRSHPMLAVVRDSRNQMLAALKALNLAAAVMPLRDKVGRPPGRANNPKGPERFFDDDVASKYFND